MDAGGVTQDSLYAAWRKAAEAVGAAPGDPDALTTAEICEFVLEYGTTDYQLRKARKQIREWLRTGIVERSQKVEEMIDGTRRPVPAFRLVETDGERTE